MDPKTKRSVSALKGSQEECEIGIRIIFLLSFSSAHKLQIKMEHLKAKISRVPVECGIKRILEIHQLSPREDDKGKTATICSDRSWSGDPHDSSVANSDIVFHSPTKLIQKTQPDLSVLRNLRVSLWCKKI